MDPQKNNGNRILGTIHQSSYASYVQIASGHIMTYAIDKLALPRLIHTDHIQVAA